MARLCFGYFASQRSFWSQRVLFFGGRPRRSYRPKPTPNAYLAAASERMLSRVQGGTPFQLKGHFTASGAKESTGSGTYEETWLSPEKWRIEISLGPYHCVRVHKSDATYQLTPDSYEPAARRPGA